MTTTIPNPEENYNKGIPNDEGVCPCCGYCKHCGRSNPQFVPYTPWITYTYYPYPSITTSGYITTGTYDQPGSTNITFTGGTLS